MTASTNTRLLGAVRTLVLLWTLPRMVLFSYWYDPLSLQPPDPIRYNIIFSKSNMQKIMQEPAQIVFSL